jgi:hypothetical protein
MMLTLFEKEVLDCLKLGVRWRLNGQRCWCPCQRLVAWKEGHKLHGEHCLQANLIVLQLEAKQREAA